MACRFNVGNLSEERTVGIMIGMEAVAAVEGSEVVSMKGGEGGACLRRGEKRGGEGIVAAEEGIDEVGKDELSLEGRPCELMQGDGGGD
jgi:hypothetical protein